MKTAPGHFFMRQGAHLDWSLGSWIVDQAGGIQACLSLLPRCRGTYGRAVVCSSTVSRRRPDRECYIRRDISSVPMTMREIHEMTLNSAQRTDWVEAQPLYENVG